MNTQYLVGTMLLLVALIASAPHPACSVEITQANSGAIAPATSASHSEMPIDGRMRSARTRKITGMVLTLTGVACLGSAVAILVGGSVEQAHSEFPTMPTYLIPGPAFSVSSVLFLALGIPFWVIGKLAENRLAAQVLLRIQPRLVLQRSEGRGTDAGFTLSMRF